MADNAGDTGRMMSTSVNNGQQQWMLTTPTVSTSASTLASITTTATATSATVMTSVATTPLFGVDMPSVTIQNLVYSILYSTVSLAAIGGNGVVIYLIINFRRMRSVTDLFILNLAFGDLLMAILCIPFTFTSNLLFHGWPFGSIMCSLVSYAQAVCVFISAYTLVAISIDRYMAIIYPLRPRMTKRHCKYLLAFIWLVALLTPLPTALLSKLVLQSAIIEKNDSVVVSNNNDLNFDLHENHSIYTPLTFNPNPDNNSPNNQKSHNYSTTLLSNKIESIHTHNYAINSEVYDDDDDVRTTIKSNAGLVTILNTSPIKLLVEAQPIKNAENSHHHHYHHRSHHQSASYKRSRNFTEIYSPKTNVSKPLQLAIDNKETSTSRKVDRSELPPSTDTTTDSMTTPSHNFGISGDSNELFICTEVWNENNDYKSYYSVILMFLQYILPFTVLVFTYTRIGLMIWGRKTPGEAHGGRDARIAASKRKMVKMMITCVVAFTLCWLPLNVFIVIGDHYPEIFKYDHIEYVWVACHWLAMSHASYNPFIYIWMNARFRNGFRYVIRRLCCSHENHGSFNRTRDCLEHNQHYSDDLTALEQTISPISRRNGKNVFHNRYLRDSEPNSLAMKVRPARSMIINDEIIDKTGNDPALIRSLVTTSTSTEDDGHSVSKYDKIKSQSRTNRVKDTRTMDATNTEYGNSNNQKKHSSQKSSTDHFINIIHKYNFNDNNNNNNMCNNLNEDFHVFDDDVNRKKPSHNKNTFNYVYFFWFGFFPNSLINEYGGGFYSKMMVKIIMACLLKSF